MSGDGDFQKIYQGIKYKTDDQRIRKIREVNPPAQILQELPLSEAAAQTTLSARNEIHGILQNNDDRLLVVVGPCSIHEPKAALEYGHRLLKLRRTLASDLAIVMRVYFEKPRTIVGWKGMINDPDLDGSFNINKGLRLARKLLLDLNETGMPCGSEFLDMVTGQYYADLVSWGAIGARTTESQVHREMASGLSCPVGFKNGTDGNFKIAIDAIRAAAQPHSFLSPTKDGQTAIFFTAGNGDGHIILRGGSRDPNYDAASVDECGSAMEKVNVPPRIIIDFSHANSRKLHKEQLAVGEDVALQLEKGERRIIGAMIESHLSEGRQNVMVDEPLKYGLSITDACLGWSETESLLHRLAGAVRRRRESR